MSKTYISSLARLENISKEHATDAGVQKAVKGLRVNLLKSWLKKEQPARKAKLKHGLSKDEWDCLHRQAKIPAIKLYRERTGLGLREAKEAVEAAMQAEFGYMSFPYIDVPHPPLTDRDY